MPETALIPARVAPDVHMTLENYKDNHRTYQNEAPKIRPQHLEKYDVVKEKETIPADEREREINEVEEDVTDDQFEKALATLPATHRRRASRIRPYIPKIYLHGQRLADVLYDLTVPAKKHKVKKLEAMAAIVRQLDNLHDLPSSFYMRKGVPSPGSTTPGSAKRVVDGTPTARAVKPLSTPASLASYFTPRRTEPRKWH